MVLERSLSPSLAVLYGKAVVDRLALVRAQLYTAMAATCTGIPQQAVIRLDTPPSEIARRVCGFLEFFDCYILHTVAESNHPLVEPRLSPVALVPLDQVAWGADRVGILAKHLSLLL